MNLNQFSARMRLRAKNVPLEVNRVKRLAALAVDQTLVLSTPVDTGRARSNWLVSLAEPTQNTIEPYAPTQNGGIAETANAQAALAQGKDVIGQCSPGQTLAITNNLPYIIPLNEGHSAQAPAGFVEAAVNAGMQAIKGARINTGK